MIRVIFRHSSIFSILRQCPSRLAYKKLIRMNMPVDADGNVNFTTTLFALIRENLCIHMRPGKNPTQCFTYDTWRIFS